MRVTQYANEYGTENYPLMIIGRSENPRCFGGVRDETLGFVYHSTKKAWINSDLFYGRILRFNSYISSYRNRRVALFLDYESCRGCIEGIPTLTNVKVIFLPKRMTSRVQPRDSGVIAALRRGYKKMLYERALCLVE